MQKFTSFSCRADVANVVVGGAEHAAAAPAAAAPAAAPSGGSALPDSATAVFMPALSSTMTEGKIVQWTKSEGDKISAGKVFFFSLTILARTVVGTGAQHKIWAMLSMSTHAASGYIAYIFLS